MFEYYLAQLPYTFIVPSVGLLVEPLHPTFIYKIYVFLLLLCLIVVGSSAYIRTVKEFRIPINFCIVAFLTLAFASFVHIS
jgi:hypothetical protein